MERQEKAHRMERKNHHASEVAEAVQRPQRTNKTENKMASWNPVTQWLKKQEHTLTACLQSKFRISPGNLVRPCLKMQRAGMSNM